MCEFINNLKTIRAEKPFFQGLAETHLKYRIFEPIRINKNLSLSIQASYAHYCAPRTTFGDNLKAYTHWEIGLISEGGDLIRVKDVLPEFPSLAEIELHWGDVYAYVPSDLVEELYVALKEREKFARKEN